VNGSISEPTQISRRQHIPERSELMNAINDLTKQEGNVLALVAQGRRNADIAQELYLSVRTVETHLYNIFKKLRISSRTEAVIYAFESGLLSKPEFSGTTQGREAGSR
jgi:DNA-binding NarL/FixJ family response regulator